MTKFQKYGKIAPSSRGVKAAKELAARRPHRKGEAANEIARWGISSRGAVCPISVDQAEKMEGWDNHMTKIIGVSGKIGTGKSTVSRMLIECGAVDAWRDFGDELKREASERFGFPLEWFYSQEGKDTEILHHELPANGHMTVRRILQWWGDVRRKQDPKYWVKRLQEWMLANRPDVLVIGDVRFREEAAWIVRHGGKLFRIEPYPEWTPGDAARHLSETNLDDWLVWEHIFRPEWGELCRVAVEIERSIRPAEPTGMVEWDGVPDGK